MRLRLRLVPRTKWGTWEAAFAAWMVACAVAWAVMPVRPRAEWRLPEPGVALGFGPGDTDVITLSRDDPRRLWARDSGLRGPVRFWGASTGRPTGAALSPSDRFIVGDWGYLA